MSNINAILLLLAALWGSVSAKASMFAVVNARRDIILTGILDGTAIKPAHRRLIFERDWKPIAWGTVIVSWLFAFVVALIPYLATETKGAVVVDILCFVVAGYNALAGLATVRHLVAETKVINDVLREIAPPALLAKGDVDTDHQ